MNFSFMFQWIEMKHIYCVTLLTQISNLQMYLVSTAVYTVEEQAFSIFQMEISKSFFWSCEDLYYLH